MRNRIFLACVTALLCTAIGLPFSANAQGSPAQAGSADPSASCPPADELASSPIGARLRELSLQPGAKIDPATFLKAPSVAEYVSRITRQQEVRKQQDWSGLCRYRAENAAQSTKRAPGVVFLGDSITENWLLGDPAFFSDKVLDRGIGGQTSSQILLRFYPDVVAPRPKVVRIMAGTNDILQNVGPVGDNDIVNNINAMIDLAKANHITVVLASILPISIRSWRPDQKPAQRLRALNARLKALAATRQIAFVDYFTALKDADNGLSAALGNDGIHPNRSGYAVMRPLANQALTQALRARR